MGRAKSNLSTWPTPRVSDTEGGRIDTEFKNGVFRSKRKTSGQWFGAKLRDAVEMDKNRNWGTPRVTTNGGCPSPQCTGKGSRLEDQVAVENWATPEARNQKGYHVQKNGSKIEKRKQN